MTSEIVWLQGSLVPATSGMSLTHQLQRRPMFMRRMSKSHKSTLGNKPTLSLDIGWVPFTFTCVI